MQINPDSLPDAKLDEPVVARILPMFPKDLVVYLEAREHGCGPRLGFAAALAKQWQAHLIATFVTRPLVLVPHADFAVGTALTEMLAEHRANTIATLARARAEFDALLDRRSFTAEWRVSDDESGEAMMLHARHASLAILGPPAQQFQSTTMLGLAESVIFASGRPSLLVPNDWPVERMPRRIVIGWNGRREAARAISEALPFLVAAESVRLIVVLDARTEGLFGQEPGADMAAHLARQGVSVELDQCKGDDAGAVLLDKCAATDADLLVIGAMGRSRVSEILFGGVTRTVFDSAKLPVMLSS